MLFRSNACVGTGVGGNASLEADVWSAMLPGVPGEGSAYTEGRGGKAPRKQLATKAARKSAASTVCGWPLAPDGTLSIVESLKHVDVAQV